MAGSQSHMTSERLERLEEVGFRWNMMDEEEEVVPDRNLRSNQQAAGSETSSGSSSSRRSTRNVPETPV